ncbi:TonB-dependent receptor [Rubrivirga sp. IMCC43871]|uniref:TonB-dependent receptor n=1 Tax=Rubrivirga sp. IMCC43871 TaxID=3391575 RepID=UPI0039900FBA
MRVSVQPLAGALRFALLALALTVAATGASAQVWGELSGRVTDDTGVAVPAASVLIEGTSFGTNTDGDGRYGFRVPEGTYPIRVSFVGYTTVRDTVVIRRGATTRYDAVLAGAIGEIGDVAVEGAAERGVGVSRIDPRTVRDMPLPMADAIRGVKTELGVTSSNELSNSFSVRGGSYDENQFFIDGFEIYRPLRISQGEQEGLGLINGDLTSRMTLFAGGFPVRYGGKLASVLDATYAVPEGVPSGTAYVSTLDAGAQVGGQLGERLGLAVAARSARPQRFFAGQELDGAYDPDFRDAQGVLDWELADNHTLRGLGLYARHRFRLAPRQQQTTFGIYPNLVQTVARDFEGVEEDGYDIAFGGALLSSTFGEAVRAEHRVSVFSIDEFETYDVTSRTSLYRREQRPEGSQADLDRFLEGQTLQRDVADNDISQTILTAQGRYLLDLGQHSVDAGWQARTLRFDDRIDELTRFTGQVGGGEIDSVDARVLVADTTFSSVQGALWVEDAVRLGRLTVTPGVRADYFAYNEELTLSPRLGLSYTLSPVTTLAGAFGIYHQAPTYRELRGDPDPGASAFNTLDGRIDSPRALQAVVGFERFFPSRRLSLRAEAYAKRFEDLISYDVENVRVVYSAENDSEGYAAGLDLQLRGELVPGRESWINYGFLVTQERFYTPEATDEQTLDEFAARGGGDWVRRPTDRRHNLSMFIQDYVPGDDTWTLHIRTLYGSGIPTTAPARNEDLSINAISVFVEGPRNRIELPSYFRFDLGATKKLRLADLATGTPLELLATVEVLNVFDQTNAVGYSWVEQFSGDRRIYTAAPTRLTPRALNVRFRVDF